MDEQNASPGARLYPNPSSDKIVVEGAIGPIYLTDKLGVTYVLPGAGKYSLEGIAREYIWLVFL